MWITGALLAVGAAGYHLSVQFEERRAREAFARALDPGAIPSAAARASHAPVGPLGAPDPAAASDAPATPATAVVQSPAPATAVPTFELAAAPDVRDFSAGAAARYEASVADEFTPVGILAIPSLSLEVLVLDGSHPRALDRGAALIEGTARPGHSGNVGIAAHRDGFFRALGDIAVGDRIHLRSRAGLDVYEVDETRVVTPDAVDVLARRDRPSLTLVTCYPFRYVGAAPERFIVHATRVEAPTVAAGTGT